MSRYLFLLMCLMFFIGCGNPETPRKVVEDSFELAMNALKTHQYEEYFDCVDYGCEMDSVQRDILIKTYAQHQDWQEQKKGTQEKLTVVDVAFCSDTICDVYYEVLYSDSTSETFSQRMTLVGDVWKIKARN